MKLIEENKEKLIELCDKHKVKELYLFGSILTERFIDSSDIDILVDYETAPTFIMLVELRDYLSQLFELKVDIVTKNGLKPRIRERVLAEAIYI